jgi:hypothetical protein
MTARDALRRIVNLLKEQGFHGSRGVLLRPIRPGFEMFVGLNTATDRGDGLIGINPVIGLRDDAVERLLAELQPERGRETNVTPTLSVSLGYLMPERKYIEWLFAASASTAPEQLVESIDRCGRPAMELLASHEAVVAVLEDKRRAYNMIYRPYRLPTAYLLLGDKESAIRTVREEVTSICGRRDEAAELYRVFAENLERRLLK